MPGSITRARWLRWPRGSLSLAELPQPPLFFPFVSSGGEMGAQNAGAQPGLRLSTHRLLLPGHCDPDAQLRAEPLVRIQLFVWKPKEVSPQGMGTESSPSVLVLPGSLQPADLFQGLEHPGQAEGCNEVAVGRRANHQHPSGVMDFLAPLFWGSFPCPACSRVAGRLRARTQEQNPSIFS